MILTEDKISEWVDSVGGLLITRQICNINEYPFPHRIGLQYVCITGYSQIISQFFEKIIQRFNSSVILIIIESDVVKISKEWLAHPKLHYCFTWNKPFRNAKMSAIPIGLNYNRQYAGITKWINDNKEPKTNTNWLCINCSASTDASRVTLMERAKSMWTDFCTVLDFIPNSSVYSIPSHIEGHITVPVTNPICYTQWSGYKFVVSPRGAGEDCHRTWEALYIGCIPIVLSSNLDELYKDLPILVVESWDIITLPFLEKNYREIQENQRNDLYNMRKITLEYWIGQFRCPPIKRIHFITYANDVFKSAKNRILSEAHAFGEFATINGYGPKDLSDDFREKHREILDMPRGAGYWIWRPTILRETLKRVRDDEYIIYMDAGCMVNLYGKKRFREYITMIDNSESGILSFQMSGNNGFGDFQQEKAWTTKEIFRALDVDIDDEHANSGQYLGGVLILKKNKHSVDFVNEFEQIVSTNPLLCTDHYNTTNQCAEFKENRHEQSISSLLRKKRGSVVIDGDETWAQPFGRGESLKYPFWATRSKK